MSMGEPQITLRPGEPSVDDGQVFARYLDEAADGFFRHLLGRRFVEILAEAYTKPGHDLSYQHVIFAEQGGAIVGMVSGYTADEHRQSSDQPLKQAAGFAIIRLAVIKFICAPLWRVLNTIRDGDFYLQAIAVDQSARGRGIGSALIDAVEGRAAAGGSARLSLDVVSTNQGARRLYEHRGMAVESRWPKRFAIGRFRLLRMAKLL